jgi:hypothetical protein
MEREKGKQDGSMEFWAGYEDAEKSTLETRPNAAGRCGRVVSCTFRGGRVSDDDGDDDDGTSAMLLLMIA